MNKKIIYVDIDETICITPGEIVREYNNAVPIKNNIKRINDLYDDGNKIVYWTARGSKSGINWFDLTKKQLESWGAKYHELKCDKPYFDLFIDDRVINTSTWELQDNLNKKIGFIAGCFDIIHPGYIKMFEDSKKICNYLLIALQTDPTIDRPLKNKPVQTIDERKTIISSIRYVDEVIVYETEKDLYNILKNTKIDVRILGSDYKNKKYTGSDLNIPVYFHDRNHNWSATNLKNNIKKQII